MRSAFTNKPSPVRRPFCAAFGTGSARPGNRAQNFLRLRRRVQQAGPHVRGGDGGVHGDRPQTRQEHAGRHRGQREGLLVDAGVCKRFVEKNGSLNCTELLGCDLGTDEGYARQRRRTFSLPCACGCEGLGGDIGRIVRECRLTGATPSYFTAFTRKARS